MTAIIGYIVLAVYSLALLYITVYCLIQFHLLLKYKQKRVLSSYESILDADLPFVTIQLPIYNEQYVVVRLIDQICQLDYPQDRFEIQVLDDSTDETLEISRKKVDEYKQKGFNIALITRKVRVGFKAGALQHGLQLARGKYIAIFDADFLPKPEFLRKTIPHFEDPKVGVVQTKWEHLNQDYSLITELQAFQLNVHFTVEQSGRQAANYLLQFNGTAGVWRRETIDDAGGWQADTLTEDLDLSYRAQLNGWTITYLEEVGSPAELPTEMNSLKAQQYRWMKGGAETARKMLPSVWSSALSFTKKLHATVHLLGSSVFVFVFIIGVFSVPLLFFIQTLGIETGYLAFFLIGLLSVSAIYYTANVQVEVPKGSRFRMVFKFIVMFPLFLSLSMGLSLHNSIAVIQGYLGKKTPFIRTPKFNIRTIRDSFSSSKYLPQKVSATTFIEGLLALYFLGAIIAAFYIHDTTFIIFHVLLTFGYGSICYYSIKHLRLHKH